MKIVTSSPHAPCVVPALKTQMIFFQSVFNAGNRLLRIRGRQLTFPGVNGDVTYAERYAIAAGILACHENAEKVITTPLHLVESFIFFW